MFEFIFVLVVVGFIVRSKLNIAKAGDGRRYFNSLLGPPPALLSNAVDLDEIRRLNWRQFELLIVQAYQRQGYTTEWRGGWRRPDGGVDILARGHGETAVVQCKHWHATSKVSVKAVRELGGVLKENKADRGIFITTAGYTDDAWRYAKNNPEIVLIDGPALIQLLAGVRNEPPIGDAQPAAAQPSQIATTAQAAPPSFRYATTPAPSDVMRKPDDEWDPDSPHCPYCNDKMVLRTAKRGGDIGQQFWGCARYPRCAGTRKVYASSWAAERRQSVQNSQFQRRRRR